MRATGRMSSHNTSTLLYLITHNLKIAHSYSQPPASQKPRPAETEAINAPGF